MEKHNAKLLLAEDDPNLGLLLQEYLTVESFEVTLVRNGEEALRATLRQKYELYLFDVMMPIKDGFSLAEQIRKTDKTTPLIFITAKSLKLDKLKGYKIGADDYITKPFDEDELVWKIKALLRRKELISEINTVTIGKYTFDRKNQQLICNDYCKRITERECEILDFLIQNQNIVLKRKDLLIAVWGKDDYFLGRSLDVFISKIRKYLKLDKEISIENVFGVGFVFNVPQQKM
jgi:DNA-binding response OmpR family regulator